jgi:hypothetical protein
VRGGHDKPVSVPRNPSVTEADAAPRASDFGSPNQKMPITLNAAELILGAYLGLPTRYFDVSAAYEEAKRGSLCGEEDF